MNTVHQIMDFSLRLLDASVLLLCALYFAYGLETLVVRSKQPPRRICSVVVILLWTATAVFHLLTALAVFDVLRANIVWISLATIAFASPRADTRSCAAWKRDGLWLWNTISARRKGLYRLVVPFCLVLIFFIIARPLWLPPLAWDAITYHAVKAALWVQQGHLSLFASPGGWGEHYRTLFGGGEVFFAWAMLPFHTDCMAGLCDAMFWVAIFLALYALARTLKASPAKSWATAFYGASLPAVVSLAGAMYVDNFVLLATILSLLFAIRFRGQGRPSDLFLSAAALGLMAGAKITSWPVALLVASYLAWHSWRALGSQRYLAWSGAALAILLPVFPWLIENWIQTGLPLGDISAQLGRFVLGHESPATLLLEKSLQSNNISLGQAVCKLIHTAFRAPWLPGVHLSYLSLPLIVLAIWTLCIRFPSKQPLGVILLGAVAAVTAVPLFLIPTFREIALVWQTTFPRFLTSGVVSLALITATVKKGVKPASGKPHHSFETYLWLGACVHLAAQAFEGWSVYDFKAILLLIVSVALAASFLLLTRRVWNPVSFGRVIMFFVIATLVLAPMYAYRQRHRFKFLAQSMHVHDIPRDVSLCSQAVDKPNHPFRIAVTAGTWPDEDNWMLYYFLGSHLQNTLLYVPWTRDGSIIDLPMRSRDDPRMSRDRWLARLKRLRVDAVMAFWPEPIEVRWMEEDPERFERLAGVYPHWGLYWVRSRPNATFWLTY